MSKKEDIINTALDLFNQIGYNATGVDKIIAESNALSFIYNTPISYIFIPSLFLNSEIVFCASSLYCECG